MPKAVDTLKTRCILKRDGALYEYFSLPEAAATQGVIARLPFRVNAILDNLLPHEDGGQAVAVRGIEASSAWLEQRCSRREIAFRPRRILMQDFTGVPSVADLAAMRCAVERMADEPGGINPLVSVDLVIDRSATVDVYGTWDAFEGNMGFEIQRMRSDSPVLSQSRPGRGPEP